MLALAFPLQVAVGAPWPAVLPYCVLVVSFVSRALYELCNGHRRCGATPRVGRSATDAAMLAYASMVVVHMLINYAAGTVGWAELAANAVNFLLPLAFYVYFRLFAETANVRSVLVGVLVASLMTGVYSVSHAYLKMTSFSLVGSPVSDQETVVPPIEKDLSIFGAMEKYQLAAGDYSRVRSGGDENYVKRTMRYQGSRSAGPLESHSVSAAWIALGMFSLLGLVFVRKRWMQYGVFLLSMLALFIFQNYTSIFAALASGSLVLLTRRSGGVGDITLPIRNRIYFIVIALICIFGVISADFHYLQNLQFTIQNHILVITGIKSAGYLATVANKLVKYWDYILQYPWTALVGDGLGIYYPYSFSKGGDVGFVETLARLGLPLSLLSIWGVAYWSRILLFSNQPIVLRDGVTAVGFPTFGIGVLIFVVLNDVHYSIWPAKSILPLVMFVFALFGNRIRAEQPETAAGKGNLEN